MPETEPPATGAPSAAPEIERLRRDEVLRRLTSLYEHPRYLEVGVSRGVTFKRVPAATRVAVDPAFAFDIETWSSDHPEVTYHEVTSDEYFSRIIDPGAQFDVIYLDGLHTFEQTLRDLTNALHHLQPQGVVLIDDTRPPTYAASLPRQEDARTVRGLMGGGEKAMWMGDVFKLVYFIDAFYPSLSYRTILNNHGQTVVWRGRREPRPRTTVGEFEALEFQDVVLDPAPLRLAPFAAVRRDLRADLGL